MEPILRTEHLTFTYPGEERPTLGDLSLEIARGSFVAVLGHNGSGKSTLAKHFNAILLPTGGKVYVDGMDTSDENNLLAVRATVGMVFQNPDNQIVANVVEDDVAFAPENLGVPPQEIKMLLAVLPETSCQGLFNQIHKKATKKVPGSTFMLLTLRQAGHLRPLNSSSQRYAYSGNWSI